MSSAMLVAAALYLVLLSQCSAYLPLLHSSPLRCCCRGSHSLPLPARQTPQSENDLQRELEVFFEIANNQGAALINKLTPEERVERATRGGFLEDEIFEARDRLMDLQARFLDNDQSVRKQDIDDLMDEINGLKDDYILAVGAADLPLYFGRTPDQLQ